jgi:tetratricopeptide (TPR) repeat protein
MSTAVAYMELVHRSNEATKLRKAGKLQEAEGILREVLAGQPDAGFDELSVALTQHELGGLLRQRGKLDEALELLDMALQAREHADEAAGIHAALKDSNLTREEMAKVLEARGDCAGARQARAKGKICANDGCEALDYTELKACSRCGSPSYCGKTCQGQDWKSRHRALCQPLANPKKAK